MSLGEKLAELRRKKDQSLQDVASSVGASKGHIWELETGKSQNPSIELLRRLADHFQVSVSWLIGETPNAIEDSNFATLYRGFSDLTPSNKEIIRTLIESMRKAGKA